MLGSYLPHHKWYRKTCALAAVYLCQVGSLAFGPKKEYDLLLLSSFFKRITVSSLFCSHLFAHALLLVSKHSSTIHSLSPALGDCYDCACNPEDALPARVVTTSAIMSACRHGDQDRPFSLGTELIDLTIGESPLSVPVSVQCCHPGLSPLNNGHLVNCRWQPPCAQPWGFPGHRCRRSMMSRNMKMCHCLMLELWVSCTLCVLSLF